MPEIHYKVIIKYINYREPHEDSGIANAIVYNSWNEILEKFPSFRQDPEPNHDPKYGDNNFLVGDSYHGIFLSHVQLTYDKVSKNCPNEETIKKYYIKNYKWR